MWPLLILVLVSMSSAGALGDELFRVHLANRRPMGRSTRGEFIMNQQFASTTENQPDKLIRMNTHRVNGFNYIGELQVGEPARKFRVLLDSGSGDLWLPQTVCKNIDRGITSTFDEKRSTSFKSEPGRRTTVMYGNGIEVTGRLCRESMKFGHLSIERQTFILADSISDGRLFAAVETDGVLGLSLQSGTGRTLSSAGPGVEAPLHEIFRLAGQQSNGPTKSIISLSLNHGMDLNKAGELIIGGLDESLYVGPISWTPLTRSNLWQFRLDSIELNFMDEKGALIGEDLTVCPHGCEAFADTGTVLIGGNSRDIRALNERIGAHPTGGGGFALDSCDNLNSRLPHLTITISGRRFSLEPGQYVYKSGPICRSALMEADAGGRWVLGQMFIGHFFVALDYDNKQFGLAESAHKSPIATVNH